MLKWVIKKARFLQYKRWSQLWIILVNDHLHLSQRMWLKRYEKIRNLLNWVINHIKNNQAFQLLKISNWNELKIRKVLKKVNRFPNQNRRAKLRKRVVKSQRKRFNKLMLLLQVELVKNPQMTQPQIEIYQDLLTKNRRQVLLHPLNHQHQLSNQRKIRKLSSERNPIQLKKKLRNLQLKRRRSP